MPFDLIVANEKRPRNTSACATVRGSAGRVFEHYICGPGFFRCQMMMVVVVMVGLAIRTDRYLPLYRKTLWVVGGWWPGGPVRWVWKSQCAKYKFGEICLLSGRAPGARAQHRNTLGLIYTDMCVAGELSGWDTNTTDGGGMGRQ